MKKEYALITGASSGIGLEISKVLAQKGFSLVLVSRREDKLKEVSQDLIQNYKTPVTYFVSDLEDPAAPKAIFEFCKNKGYFISVLVNNAGYALPDAFHKTPMEAEEKFLRVLGISVVALTKLFLPDMITAKEGKIMMISSVAAFAPPSTIQTLYGPYKNRSSTVLVRG
jgi:short-subunit dehydrogenase